MTGREWRCLMLALIVTSCMKSKGSSLVGGEVLQHVTGQCLIDIYRQDISNINSSHCVSVMVVGSVTIDCDQIRDEQLVAFQLITEITGFLSIINCNRSIPLHNLTVIHGHTQTNLSSLQQSFLTTVSNHSLAETWSLLVHNSSLDKLQLYRLKEVVRGRVFIHDTGKVCVHRSVRWSDILSSGSQMAGSVFLSNCTMAMDCHGTCHGACWDSDPNHCQPALSWDECETGCYHRCHTGGCCHSECVGGCSGPDRGQCVACRHFRSNGTCVASCSPLSAYNPDTHLQTVLPDGEYLLHYDCVKECPEPYMIHEERCVLQCPYGTTENNRVCERCNGLCPKVCLGSGQLPGESPHITSLYIDRFTNCTHINGNIILNRSSLEGNMIMGVPPMTQGSLWALSHVEEVTGYVVIEGLNVTGLRFLHNLHTVQGNELLMAGFSSYSIVIRDNPLLATLSLVSLHLVERGSIWITNCSQLCLADTLSSDNIIKDLSQYYLIVSLVNFNCEGVNCHRECDSMAGCWGTGADECIHCKNYHYGNSCIASCDQSHSYEEHFVCLPCHDQCNLGCYGPTADQCIMGCSHYTDGPYCVAECPPFVTYPSDDNSCLPCDPLCDGNGCSGNGSHLGPGGCDGCHVILNINGTDYCVNESCPLGYQLFQYPLRANSTYAGSLVCTRELQVSLTGYTQLATQSLITNSGVFTSEGIASLSSHLTMSPSITTPFKGSDSENTNFYQVALITTTVLIGVVIVAILLALLVYCVYYTHKTTTVKVAVINTNVDLQETTHKRTPSGGDSQTLLDYTISKQGLLRRTSIATLANGMRSECDSIAVLSSSPLPSERFSQPQSRLGDGLSSYSVSPSMVVTEEREKKRSASLKSSSLSPAQLSAGTMTGEYWSPHHDGMASRHSLHTRDNASTAGGSPQSRDCSCYSPSIQLPGSVLEEPLTYQ